MLAWGAERREVPVLGCWHAPGLDTVGGVGRHQWARFELIVSKVGKTRSTRARVMATLARGGPDCVSRFGAKGGGALAASLIRRGLVDELC